MLFCALPVSLNQFTLHPEHIGSGDGRQTETNKANIKHNLDLKVEFLNLG